MNCPPGFAYQTPKLLWFNFYVHFKQSLSVIWQDYTTSTFTTCINSYTNGVFFKIPYIFLLIQEKIKEMFENLMQVEHPNIVKFHKYWLDMKETQARVRSVLLFLFLSLPFIKHTIFSQCVFSFSTCGMQVIFITEYMSSGSLKQFLKKTKKNHKTMNVKVRIVTLGHIFSCRLEVI